MSKETGVRLTTDDFYELSAAVEQARSAPVIGYGATGLVTMAQMAQQGVRELANRLAVKYGLPDSDWWWTVDNNGQFIVPDGYEERWDAPPKEEP